MKLAVVKKKDVIIGFDYLSNFYWEDNGVNVESVDISMH